MTSSQSITLLNVDVELLRKQRNSILGVMDLEGITPQYEELLSGVVNMMDCMLDKAEGYPT